MAIALTAEINGNKRVTNCLLTPKKKSKYFSDGLNYPVVYL